MSGERRSGVERKKERLSALLYLATQDTEAAKLLAVHDNHYAAYYCQQAAEKLIRVLLLHHDIEPGLDHHLDVLVAKLPEGEPWKTKLAPLHKYTPYATTYRYATSYVRWPRSTAAAGVDDQRRPPLTSSASRAPPGISKRASARTREGLAQR